MTTRTRCPLVRRWDASNNPLPLHVIRVPAEPLSSLPTRPQSLPFNFCSHMRRLCADIAARCRPLWHLDVNRILFAVTQARSGQAHGHQARLTPLRFRQGRLTHQLRGITYQAQRYVVDARDMLYLVTFCLPRFLDLDINEKWITIFHELFHIHPAFDGDLRRYDGRNSKHGHGRRGYDQHMARLARAYLAAGADPVLHAFLRLNFAHLQARHGSVVGVMVPRPKMIPVPARAMALNS